ncbi:MAG: amino acid permease, partial [Burkholderiales bacterium]|nr:amino acid permease [Burkholderiales bacterium]
IVAVSGDSLANLPERFSELIPAWDSASWWGVGMGAFLAFYAFIGFEDMVNVAEEVKDPQRNVPTAIVLALISSTVLYLLVVTAAVLALPVATLSQSGAPL